MKFSTISNIGKIRQENEDAYANTTIGDLDFFIVADGMGGHSRGEVASKLASKSYIDFIENANLDDYTSYVDLQEEAIKYANSKIYNLSDDSEDLRMGTTVVCMLVDRKNATYYISHVGDSRIYIYQDKKLRVKTRDHSLINDLIDTGSLTEDEAENFINKSAITKAVGTEEVIEPESQTFSMKDGDIVLMFTDGLSNELTDEEITKVVNESHEAYDISSRLVELALNKGGRDNITVTTILI